MAQRGSSSCPRSNRRLIIQPPPNPHGVLTIVNLLKQFDEHALQVICTPWTVKFQLRTGSLAHVRCRCSIGRKRRKHRKAGGKAPTRSPRPCACPHFRQMGTPLGHMLLRGRKRGRVPGRWFMTMERDTTISSSSPACIMRTRTCRRCRGPTSHC